MQSIQDKAEEAHLVTPRAIAPFGWRSYVGEEGRRDRLKRLQDGLYDLQEHRTRCADGSPGVKGRGGGVNHSRRGPGGFAVYESLGRER